MTAHKIEVLVDAGADEVIGRLGHRRPAWLRPFLLLARRSVGDGASGGVDYRLGAVVDAADGSRVAAFQWHPEAAADLFGTFSGRMVVRPHADHVTLAVEGDAEGGNDQVNADLLEDLMKLLAAALAEADRVAR